MFTGAPCHTTSTVLRSKSHFPEHREGEWIAYVLSGALAFLVALAGHGHVLCTYLGASFKKARAQVSTRSAGLSPSAFFTSVASSPENMRASR